MNSALRYQATGPCLSCLLGGDGDFWRALPTLSEASHHKGGCDLILWHRRELYVTSLVLLHLKRALRTMLLSHEGLVWMK